MLGSGKESGNSQNDLVPRLRVCHFCQTSVEGAYFRHIATSLTNRGVQVSLLEMGPRKPPTWLGEVPGVRYSSLGITSRLQYPIAVLKLTRFLMREKIDILQTHLYFAGLIGVLTKYIGGRAIVVLTRHHTSVVRMLGKWPHIAADKWMAEKADFVVTVSKAVKQFMTDIDQIRRSDIEVVYLGFNFDEFKPDIEARTRIRSEFGFDDDEIVIGYIASFADGKGHVQLIQAFRQILESAPTAKLFLVGEGNRKNIDAAIESLGIGSRVIFSGWRTDSAACLNGMDIFVQPSLSEAFSQVLIEAMGVGLPVVATKVGGAAEVIRSEIDGVLIEPNNVKAIADAVSRLTHESGFSAALGRAGRASVRERFTVETMVERQLDLYNHWIADRTSVGVRNL